MTEQTGERINVPRLIRAAQERALVGLSSLDLDASSDSDRTLSPSGPMSGLTQPQVMTPTEGRRNMYRGVRLSRDNYTAWQFSMRTHLKSIKLWRFVQDASLPEDDDRNKCLDQIVMSLDNEQLLLIVECESPFDAWTMLEQEHRRGTAENILFIRQDFSSRKWDAKTEVKTYLQDMREMALKLTAAGSKVTDHELCMSILLGVQASEYRNVVGTLTIGRTSELKYSEVRSALLTAEQTFRRMNPKKMETR